MTVLGKRLRKIMPEGNSLTQFVYARYGSKMLKIVLALSLFYVFIYLCAEVTAIAKNCSFNFRIGFVEDFFAHFNFNLNLYIERWIKKYQLLLINFNLLLSLFF